MLRYVLLNEHKDALIAEGGSSDLVWTYGVGKAPDDTTYPIRSVMTAPFTTEPDQLQPRRLRSYPGDVGAWQWSVGCGHAATATPATYAGLVSLVGPFVVDLSEDDASVYPLDRGLVRPARSLRRLALARRRARL